MKKKNNNKTFFPLRQTDRQTGGLTEWQMYRKRKNFHGVIKQIYANP